VTCVGGHFAPPRGSCWKARRGLARSIGQRGVRLGRALHCTRARVERMRILSYRAGLVAVPLMRLAGGLRARDSRGFDQIAPTRRTSRAGRFSGAETARC